MENTFQDKIKSVIAKTGMTYKELAIQLGVSVHNLYKWKETSNPRNHKEYEKVIRGLDGLLENESPENMLEEPQATYIIQSKKTTKLAKPLMVAIFLSDDSNFPFFIDEAAVPGSVTTINGKRALIAWRNDSPFIGEADGLIAVTDESMEPRFKNGSWIAIKKLKYIKIITAGYYYYVIDKNGKGLLRKAKISGENNSLTLLSENETDYPTITRDWEDILAIFSIEAVVTKQST